MKKTKITYWIFTSIIVAFDSLLPALTSGSKMAVESIRRLGYPDYFRVELTVFKVLGGIVLILPMIPRRVKEWAYAGFAFNFICAFVADLNADGPTGLSFLPLVILAFLIISYISYDKLYSKKIEPSY